MDLKNLFGNDCVLQGKYIEYRMIGAPLVENFVIGEKTMDAILKIPFGCQRCGSCCSYKGKECRHLGKEKYSDIHSCEIHGKENFPLSCFSYPIRIDELAVEGIGARYSQRYDQLTGEPIKKRKEDYVWYEIGCATAALMLVLYSSDPALGKGKHTLAEHALSLLDKLPNSKPVPVAPPAEFLCSGVVAVTGDQAIGKFFTDSEMGNAMDRIRASNFTSFRPSFWSLKSLQEPRSLSDFFLENY